VQQGLSALQLAWGWGGSENMAEAEVMKDDRCPEIHLPYQMRLFLLFPAAGSCHEPPCKPEGHERHILAQ
jgi:hypothetical protein